ncbi:hypothetical protein OS493_033660, partial [Desmophyllum pertusum]
MVPTVHPQLMLPTCCGYTILFCLCVLLITGLFLFCLPSCYRDCKTDLLDDSYRDCTRLSSLYRRLRPVTPNCTSTVRNTRTVTDWLYRLGFTRTVSNFVPKPVPDKFLFPT